MKRNEFWLSMVFLFGVVPAFIIAVVVVEKNYEIKTLTIALVAFAMGTTFEFWRMTRSWQKTLLYVGSALVVSLIAFMPGKKEHVYVLQSHLNFWPLAFVGGLILIFVAMHEKELTPKLGEGITTLHSLALLYFLAELYDDRLMGWGWLAICFVISLFSFIHALTYLEINRGDRLWLSLWSSVIMSVFAVVYVKSVLDISSVESFLKWDDYSGASYVCIEYFLLGVSGAYIAQNLFMLLGYLPDKHRFFNQAYFNDVHKLNQSHIARYSAEQVDKRQALAVILVVGGCLLANFVTKKIAPSFAVWLCMTLVPLFLRGGYESQE